MKGYLFRVGLAMSMLLNVLLGGDVGQTFSARNHEAKRNKKINIARFIDKLFGKDHCIECWAHWKVRKW